jgi:hypothetical protein
VSNATRATTPTEARSHTRLVLGLCGTMLLVGIFVWVGPRAVAAQLLHVGPQALWIFAPYVIGTAIGAFPWAWLLPPQARPRYGPVIVSRFAASGANALLPFFGLAGEPLRLMWLAHDARARGLAAIIVDRVVYNMANALLLLAGALIALRTAALPVSLGVGAAVIALVIGLVTAGIGAAVARFEIGHRLQAILAKRLHYLHGQPGFGAEVDHSLRSLLRGPGRRLWAGLVVHVAGRAALCGEVYVGLRILGVTTSIDRALMLATVPIATGLIASSIPSQIGVQEAALSLVSGALDIPPAAGFALVLLLRARQLAFIPLTPLLVGSASSATLEGRPRGLLLPGALPPRALQQSGGSGAYSEAEEPSRRDEPAPRLASDRRED